MTNKAKLTAKQERFAQLVASGKTQVDAYRLAYDGSDEPRNGLYADSGSLAAHPMVSLRIAELAKRYANVAEIDAIYVLSSLKANVERAMQATPVLDRAGKPTGEWQYEGAVANKALELLGKHLGMFINRIEHTGPLLLQAERFASLSDDDLDALIQAGKALLEAKAQVIEGEARMLEAGEGAD
jgi:phage terminase small subunit